MGFSKYRTVCVKPGRKEGVIKGGNNEFLYISIITVLIVNYYCSSYFLVEPKDQKSKG